MELNVVLGKKPRVESTPPISTEYSDVYDMIDVEHSATTNAVLATDRYNTPVHQQGKPSPDRQSNADPGDSLYSEIPEISSIQEVCAEDMRAVTDYKYTAVQKKSVGLTYTL